MIVYELDKNVSNNQISESPFPKDSVLKNYIIQIVRNGKLVSYKCSDYSNDGDEVRKKNLIEFHRKTGQIQEGDVIMAIKEIENK